MKRTITLLAACAGSFLLGAFVTAPDDPKKPLTSDMLDVASRVFGLEFTAAERDSMLDNVNNARTSYEALRKIDLPNDVAPALYFNPLPAVLPRLPGRRRSKRHLTVRLHFPQTAMIWPTTPLGS
jgi:hypothetical protein